jgi:hypothetical protein
MRRRTTRVKVRSDHRAQALQLGATAEHPDAQSGAVRVWVEVATAAAAFLVMCVVTLSVAPQSAEPDDGAYRASIVAITDGHFLTLSETQALALAAQLHDNPAAPPNQWAQVAPDRYLSEKDPGYPFLAAPFQKLGLIRWTPLFFGGLACVGLFIGARRWLGPFGGAAAVGLYCSSGAALAFAWRDYMPTFTDASLVAAGSGFLLWALLASTATPRRRLWVGLGGFLALEAATFVRYTNVVILACAVITVLLAWRLRRASLPRRALRWWLSSVAAFGACVAAFDTLVYGGPLTTGYPTGEVTFSLGAIGPNLHLMPAHLIQAMPLLLLAAASILWIVVRSLASRDASESTRADARRDLSVCLALGGAWVAIWFLYATYTWTIDPTNATVSDIRFYLPALGPVTILAAWLVTRIPRDPRLTGPIIVGVTVLLFAQGTHQFHAMYAAFGVPIHT